MNYFKKYFPIILFGIFLATILLPFYRDGKMISGWEGGYFLDFPLMLKNYGYSWFNWGTGIFATSLNFGYVFHLAFLQKLVPDERIINFVMIYSLYFLPFLAIYLLSLELKLKWYLALLMAVFYLANPFTANFLKSINQWNMLAAYILPAFLWLILKFYDNSWKLFFFFGLHSLFFAFTNANPPTMVLYQVALVFFVIFASLFKEKKFHLKAIVGKYCLVLFSFIFFNFWWILNWFYVLPDAQQGYTKEFVMSWLKRLGEFVPVFWQNLTLTGILQYPINPQYDYFAKHYSYFFTPILLVIPILIIISFLLKKKLIQVYHLVLMLMLMVIGFLSKGINNPFGGIYEFLVMYFPFFSIFKSAGEKWGLLFIFLLTLYLIIILKEIKKEKFYCLILSLLIIYVGYSAVPFVNSNFLPDYRFNENIIGSKNFLDKVEYQNLRKELNSDPTWYRVLSLPGSLNYQVALHIEGKRFYTGNDPVLSNTNKPFIAPYNETFTQSFWVLFDKISHPDYLKLLGLYNIKKIVINKDMYPWFGFREKEDIPQLERIFNEKLKSDKNNVIDFYDVGDYYLPRFYIPKKIIFSPDHTQDDFLDLISLGDWDIRSGIYLEHINGLMDSKINELEGLKGRADEIFVKGKLENAINEEELGVSYPEVFFPYVWQKPGSFFYPLVLEKEKLEEWKVRKETEKLFEKHLFYASKRVSEIMAFGVNEQVLANYKKEMTDALGILNKLKQEGSKDFVKLLAKYEETLWGQREKIKELKNLTDWDNAFQELKGQAEELKTKRDFSKLAYKIEIPKEGEYEIYLREEEIERLRDLETEELEIDGNKVETNWSWVKLGERNFEEGTQELVLPFSGISENLVDEDLRIRDYFPDSIYRISFDYKDPKGGSSFFIAEEDGKKVAETVLSSTGGKFRHFEKFFKSSSEVKRAIINLAVPEEKNLKVERIYQPEIVLRSINHQSSVINHQLPQITFVKINPTKYRIKVEGAKEPYTIIFSESFHQGWKAYINKTQNDYGETVASYFDGQVKEGTSKNIFLDSNIFETLDKKSISEEKHLLVNGYANSWYITTEDSEGSENYEIIIEFLPQRLFYIGLLISGLTLIGCLGILIYSYLRKKLIFK